MLRITHRSLTATAGAIALVGVLAACSAPSADQSPEGDTGIATLETTAPAPTEAADALIAEYGEPVRLRLDMSDEEEADAWKARDRCLEDHTDAPQDAPVGGGGDSVSASDGGDPVKAAEAEALCLRVAPLPPWELDVQNPDALRFAQGVVDCLHDRGVREVEIAEADQFGRINIAFGGETNDATSISLGMQYVDACVASESDGSAA
ncbi:hypothetical protein C5E06_14505 [Pseudoclavibacter sp. RFBI5]|uniref:hypothetical protein n=1 Tax=Pseudoclavibacter sp. RFBI5 TaxID=2080578 RepID=UPI000CE7C4B9|nr:hypothetical protein [Pseudoclavibacter sp. RFBI5]PPG01889.1 hypothetical protein C5E06_14505 [Pseudoclavibacter sp. RFBI5]